MPPGRLQINTSTTQNLGPQRLVSDIKDTARRTPDNDRVSSSQVDPVFGRVIVERQQHVDVLGDLRDRLGPLGAVVGLERFDRL